MSSCTRGNVASLGLHLGMGGALLVPICTCCVLTPWKLRCPQIRADEIYADAPAPAAGSRMRSGDNVWRPMFAAIDSPFDIRVAALPGMQEGASV